MTHKAFRRAAVLMAAVELVVAGTTRGQTSFTTSFGVVAGAGGIGTGASTDTFDPVNANNSNIVYVQGFSPSQSPNPPPGAAAGDAVTLSQFEFIKSANTQGNQAFVQTSSSQVYLAILNQIFPGNTPNNRAGTDGVNDDVAHLTTLSADLVGLSSNTVNPSGIATGAPIQFNFSTPLSLTYGNNYAAVYVVMGDDQGNGPTLTPALVDSYVTNNFTATPPTSYGATNNFNFATSNFISGGFFSTFNNAADADFLANLSFTPTVTGQTWTGASNGTWSDASGGNWSPSGAPNAVGAQANFGALGPIASGRYTVTLDAGGDTVGSINLSGTANSYTIGTTSGPALTLAVSAGAPVINVNSGSHTIAAPLTLGSNTTVNVLSGSVLTLSLPLTTANTVTISKSGAGTVSVPRLSIGTLSIFNAGGVVQVTSKATANSAAGTSVMSNLLLGNSGATLDLTDNSLILTGTTVDAVRGLLFGNGGFNPGLITTSTANGGSLGYLDNSSANRAIWGGIDASGGLTPTSILVGYTVGGDANFDGKVNALDFNAIAANYGAAGTAHWIDGDFNYDGSITTADFGILAGNFGDVITPLPSASLGALVPEPATASLLAVAGTLLLNRRRRIVR